MVGSHVREVRLGTMLPGFDTCMVSVELVDAFDVDSGRFGEVHVGVHIYIYIYIYTRTIARASRALKF